MEFNSNETNGALIVSCVWKIILVYVHYTYIYIYVRDN
jgi:hypothetical protein